MGKMMSAIMNKIINDVLAEVLLVMSCIYFTVAISEFLGLCGPLAVLAVSPQMSSFLSSIRPSSFASMLPLAPRPMVSLASHPL